MLVVYAFLCRCSMFCVIPFASCTLFFFFLRVQMFEGLIRPKYKSEEAALMYAEDKTRPVFHSTKYPPGMTQ